MRLRCLSPLVVLIGLLTCTIPAGASAATPRSASASVAGRIGILPPQVPATNCTAGASQRSVIEQIDYCRAREGVGPMVLPANYSRLTAPQQMLTVINSERVSRGLAPDIGLNRSLNGLAQRGASADTDPGFPTGEIRTDLRRPFVYDAGGSIWAESSSVLEADLDWMYEDGPGSNNLACQSAGAAGCWGHRSIILSDQGSAPLVAGGGVASTTLDGYRMFSYAFEQLYGYSTQLTWGWQPELRHFTVALRTEREQAPRVTGASLSNGVVTLTGTNLIGMTAALLGSIAGTHLFCATESTCTVQVAAVSLPSTLSVTASDLAGTLARTVAVL